MVPPGAPAVSEKQATAVIDKQWAWLWTLAIESLAPATPCLSHLGVWYDVVSVRFDRLEAMEGHVAPKNVWRMSMLAAPPPCATEEREERNQGLQTARSGYPRFIASSDYYYYHCY